MTDTITRSDCDWEDPPARQRDLMELLSQDTRHRIIQTLLGHPEHLASADELIYFNPNKSISTVAEQLDVLLDADILGIYEHPPNKAQHGVPWRFYGFTEYGVGVLRDFNYLMGVPIAQAIHQKTRNPRKSSATKQPHDHHSQNQSDSTTQDERSRGSGKFIRSQRLDGRHHTSFPILGVLTVMGHSGRVTERVGLAGWVGE